MGLTAIIPARGGSKRIPRKNLVDLGGKPLIAWTIEAALEASPFVDRVVVSTEDEEIASVSKLWGAEVLERPMELAADDVPTRDVTWHAIDTLGIEGPVALLHPTSPFRGPRWIKRAWGAVHPYHNPVASFTNDELNGALYTANGRDLYHSCGSFFRLGPVLPLEMPLPDGLDIDTPQDLALARSYVEQKAVA